MADKKDPAQLRNIQQTIKLETTRANIAKLQEKLAKKMSTLIEKENLSREETALLEQEIVDLQTKRLDQAKKLDKFEKQIQRSVELEEKPLQRMLENVKARVKESEKVSKLEAALSDKLGKSATKTTQIGRELVGWGTSLKKANEYFKNITDQESKAQDFFSSVAKLYYVDLTRGAEAYLRLQDEIIANQATAANKLTATAAGIGSDADKQQLADSFAGIEKLRQAQDSLSRSARKLGLNLGLPGDEMEKLAYEIGKTTNLDIRTDEARKAILEVTEAFVVQKKKGLIPAQMSLEEFIASAKEFGTSLPKDIIRSAKQFRVLAEMPRAFARNITDPRIAQVLDQNYRSMASNAQKVAKDLRYQNIQAQDLANTHIALNVAALKYGASLDNAAKFAERIQKGLSNQLSVDVNVVEIEAAKDIMQKNRESGGQYIQDLVSQLKFETDEQRQVVTAEITKAFASGDVYNVGYALKHLEALPAIMEDKLKVVDRVSGAGGDSSAIRAKLLEDMGLRAETMTERAIQNAFFANKDFKGLLASEEARKAKKEAEDRSLGVTAEADKAQILAASRIEKPTNLPGDMFDSFFKDLGPALGLTAGAGIGALIKAKGADALRGVAEKAARSLPGLSKEAATTTAATASSNVTKAAQMSGLDLAADDIANSGSKVAQNLATSADDIAKAGGKAPSAFAQTSKAIASALTNATKGAPAALGKVFSSVGKAGSALGGAAKTLGPLGAAIGGILQTSDILANKDLDAAKKSSETAGVVAETAASFNLVGAGLQLARFGASAGSRALGAEDTANWIDKNVKLTALTEPLGEALGSGLYNLFNDKPEMFTPPPPATKVSPAPAPVAAAPGAAPASQAMSADGVTAVTKSTSMTLNPDGSSQFDLTLTIPAFQEAVYQTITKANYPRR